LAAIVGGVLVAGEARAREFTLLRTLGYTPTQVRGAVVREIFIVSLIATVAAVAVASLVSVVAALPLAAGRVIGVAAVGCLAPPFLTFVAVRPSLERPLAPQLSADTAGEEP
jgi:ABC-type antimicrobial peptide transport system permease subunit